MMRWIVGTSLRSRGLVVALGAAVMILGISQFGDMPRDLLPEFSPPTVEVQTEALGLSAEEVEQLITVPLEQDLLNGVAFLDSIRSESVPGLSRIDMVFEPGTDLYKARQVVNERLTQAHALPNVSRPPQMLQPLSSTSRVMMVRLSSEERSLMDMSLLARWTMRPQLMGIQGVANVSIWGQREQQLQVRVDPAELQARGVSLDQVIRTTGNALWWTPLSFLEGSTPGTGGILETDSQRFGIQPIQPIATPADLARVPLEKDTGSPASGEGPRQTLGDVATVVEDHQPLIGDAVFGDGPGLLLVVEKFPEANTLEVTSDLENALENLAPGLSGIDVDSSLFRPANYLEESTDNLRTALLIGLVLLVLALGALVFELRTVFISLVSILLSLAGAIVVLHARGETINAMVLAGLVLALIVLIDDAVVSAAGIRRSLGQRREGAGERSTATGFATAVLAVRGPLTYATVILLLALLPILVLHGETGAFLPSIALSYAGAVLVSMVVAMTVTPALAVLLLSDAPRRRASPLLGWLQPSYDRALARFVGTPRPGLIAIAGLLVLGIAMVPVLDRGDSLLPAFKDRDVLVHWNGAPGTSLTEMSRITARAGEELAGLAGVDNVGGHVGRAILGDQVVGVNAGELWVSIDASAEYEGTVESIEEVVNGYPGIERSVLSYPRERIDEVLTTADGVEGKDLTVRVFGQDLDTMRAQADGVREAVAEIDGVEAPVVELPVEEPTLEVEVDLDRAQALGIKPGDVRRAAATVLSGIEVGNLFEEQKIFEVVVWGTPETRHSLDSIGELLIDTEGGQVPLEDVADVRVEPSPNVIRHEDVSRSIDVGVDVSGRDLDAVAANIEERIHDMQFPLEYHAELLGDYDDRQASRVTFIGVALAAALGIFLLLQAAFASWRMASVAFLVLPAALTGGLLAAVIDGDLLSIGSIVGFLAVFGLAVRHSVLFVRHCQDLEDLEGEPFGPHLVRGAARERFVPTLMTAIAAAVVLVPLLFFGGLAGHEIVHPMAAVILGGLVASTVLNLFVVPALYLRFGSRPAGGRERFDMVLDLTAAERGREDRHAPVTVDA